MGSPALDQLALADLLERGELDRHLRRMRPIYRGRRDALLAALARHLPELRPVGRRGGPPRPRLAARRTSTRRPSSRPRREAGIALGGLAARRIAPGRAA